MSLKNVIEILGIICLVAAAFAFAVPAGLAVLGVSLIVLGNTPDRKETT